MLSLSQRGTRGRLAGHTPPGKRRGREGPEENPPRHNRSLPGTCEETVPPKMGRRATAATADDEQPEQPTVKCDACGRWAYLEETPFADLGKAEIENAPFTCRGCQRVKALEAQIAEYATELARWTKCECCARGGERISGIETRVRDVEAHTQRDRPEGQIVGRLASPLVTAQHLVKDRVDKATDTEDGDPSKADTEALKTVHEQIAPAEDNHGTPV